MSGKKRATRTTWTDPDDAPELTEEFFERADKYAGARLVRRGRPKAEATKVAVTVRYDADVVEAFRATGKGWQTRMNAVLRNWVRRQPAARAR